MDMKEYLLRIILIYSLHSILGLANAWIVFEKFFDYQKQKKKREWIWIIFYLGVMFLYRPVNDYAPEYIRLIVLVFYSINLVPFLWTKYGKKLNILLFVLLYGNVIDSISLNIRFVFLDRINLGSFSQMKSEIAVVITEIIIVLLLALLIFLKQENILKICFTKLTVWEYLMLFCMNLLYGLLEAAIFREYKEDKLLSSLCIITFVILMLLFLHIITVRDQHSKMNSMIGNLKEPMKQITASYIEMNEKNTEIRRFRHDTKNLLFALRTMIMEEKYSQAMKYLDEMQVMMDATKSKLFDTGNFIADALLESKAKMALKYDITMTVDGFIPANRIEDVNLVILISNLVDNAIEAAKQVEGEKKIEIKSILKKNIWILSVKNSCIKDVVIRENHIETTKSDKEAHGFGVLNVERVTKKYNGKLQLSCENKEFTAIATLMLAS